jgi:hypothetical protein
MAVGALAGWLYGRSQQNTMTNTVNNNALQANNRIAANNPTGINGPLGQFQDSTSSDPYTYDNPTDMGPPSGLAGGNGGRGGQQDFGRLLPGGGSDAIANGASDQMLFDFGKLRRPSTFGKNNPDLNPAQAN